MRLTGCPRAGRARLTAFVLQRGSAAMVCAPGRRRRDLCMCTRMLALLADAIWSAICRFC